MHSPPNYCPTYYKITVLFKPEGVPIYKASDTKEVTFKVKLDLEDITKEEMFKRGRKEIVEKQVLDADILKQYWEPYDIDIAAQTPPDGLAELYGD